MAAQADAPNRRLVVVLAFVRGRLGRRDRADRAIPHRLGHALLGASQP